MTTSAPSGESRLTVADDPQPEAVMNIGDRVVLLSTDDPHSQSMLGTEGTVTWVDDGALRVRMDTGPELRLTNDRDDWARVMTGVERLAEMLCAWARGEVEEGAWQQALRDLETDELRRLARLLRELE